MSKVYLVFGSEDGNLGVFGSKKRATERAVAYCSDRGDSYDENVEVDSATTPWFVYVDGNGLNATVECFVVE